MMALPREHIWGRCQESSISKELQELRERVATIERWGIHLEETSDEEEDYEEEVEP